MSLLPKQILHLERKKIISRFLTIIILVSCFVILQVGLQEGRTVRAQTCAWQLVSETPSSGNVSTAPEATVSLSGSTLNVNYQGLSTTHTWTAPSPTLNPGDVIEFRVSVSWNYDTNTASGSLSGGLSTNLSFRGVNSVSARRSSINFSTESSGNVTNKIDWIVPMGSQVGASLEIRGRGDAAVGYGSVTYKYQFVCVQPTVDETLMPQITETVGVESTCYPVISNISNLKPGDVLSPADDYVDEDGNPVGIIGSAWYINGKAASSVIWDGKETVLELQYTCLNNKGYSKTYIIPAYGTVVTVTPTETPSSGINPPIPQSPGGIPGEVVAVAVAVGLGGGGIIGGIAVISVLNKNKKKPPDKKDEPKQKKRRIFLTVDKRQITLSVGESTSLTIQAWEQVEGETPKRCIANLKIYTPGKSGLSVSPTSGQGELQTVVLAVRSTISRTITLHIVGTAYTGQVLRADVSVRVRAQQYELRCDPLEAECYPGDKLELEVSLFCIQPNGIKALDVDTPVQLKLFGEETPLTVSPQSGVGKFKCEVIVPSDTPAKRYYVQAVAMPADQPEELICLVTLIVKPPPTLAVIFDKILWQPNTRVDPYSLKDADIGALNDLALEGGELTVRAFGSFRDGEQVIQSHHPIEDGDCKLERSGEILQGTWKGSDYAYTIKVPPLPAHTDGKHHVTLNIPVEVAQNSKHHLVKILKNTGKSGEAMGTRLGKHAEDYVVEYLDYIAKNDAETLSARKKEILTWLFHTATFSGHTVESIKAFKLALNLHESAYHRFFDAMINFVLEVIFFFLEKGADYLWKNYVNKGKEALKESIESETKQVVEEKLEKEVKTLAKQKDNLDEQIKQVLQESSDSHKVLLDKKGKLGQLSTGAAQQQKELMEAQTRRNAQKAALAATDDEAAQQAIKKELDALENQIKKLEGQIADGILEVKNLSEVIDAYERNINASAQKLAQLQKEAYGLQAQMDTLGKMKSGVQKSTNMKEVSEAISDVKPPHSVQDPKLQQALKAYIDGHWRDLDRLIRFIEQNRNQIKNADELLSRVRALQEKLRKDLALDTDKMIIDDFNIRPEIQEQTRQINDAINQVQRTAPSTYKALDRKFFEDGVIGWGFHKMDQALEWFYKIHRLAREWILGFAWVEDTIVAIVEGVFQRLVDLTNWMIEQAHPQKMIIRSVLRPNLRTTGIRKSKEIALDDAFFTFPANAIKSLGTNLSPAAISNSNSNRSNLSQQLNQGATSQYQTERARQQSEAWTYFENTILRALSHDFDAQPNDINLEVNTTSILKLQAISKTMNEYVTCFGVGKSSIGEMVPNLQKRLWEAEEWTAQDLEVLVEWIVWAMQSLAILFGVIGIMTGVGAAAGATLLTASTTFSHVGAILRIAIISMLTLPNIVGFQYDIIALHALIYDILYEGL